MTQGFCFCKRTSFEFTGAPVWQCYCHCDDCRRNCAAPVVGWLGVKRENFKWTGDAPKSFNSSKGVTRHMCAQCGTPIGFEADHYPGDIELYAATLENPESFHPTFHVNWESKLPWLALEDDLPKYNGTLREQEKSSLPKKE